MMPYTTFGLFKGKGGLIAVLALQASNAAKYARQQKKYDIPKRIRMNKVHFKRFSAPERFFCWNLDVEQI
jgi:hypothetical protein